MAQQTFGIRWLCGVVAALVASVGLAKAARAATFEAGERYVLEAGERVEDDLVITGDAARIEGTVVGDVVMTGGKLVIEGAVTGDVLFAGQSLELTGEVGDDLRFAGYALRVGPEGRVGDDLGFAGYSLESAAGSEIGGDVASAGYQTRLAGVVSGGARLEGSAVEIAGIILGDVDARASGGPRPRFLDFFFGAPFDLPDAAPGFGLGESARIGGGLAVRAPQDPGVDDQVGGAVDFERIDADGRAADGSGGFVAALGRMLSRAITLGVVAALLLWLAPETTARLAARVRREPLPCLGWGAAVALGVVGIAAGLAAAIWLLDAIAGSLTLGGLTPAIVAIGVLGEALVLTPFGVAASTVAPAIVALVVGRLALERAAPGWLDARWREVLAAALVTALACELPWIGGAIAVAIVLLGVGTLALGARRLFTGEDEDAVEGAAA